MIAVRPHNLAGRILARIVAYPGEYGTEDLADALGLLPAFPAPGAGFPARYLAWRRERVEAEREVAATVSRLLGRLQEQGLVESRRPLEITATGRALLRSPPDEEDAEGWSLVHVAILRAVEDAPRPATEALAAAARVAGVAPGSGTIRRAYAELCGYEAVIPPSYRWPTERGIALVRGWGPTVTG